MKRSMMHIYVVGSRDAVNLYLKAFNGSLGYNVKNSDDSFYHAEIDIFGHILSLSEANDGMDKRITGNTMQFC
ncbi:MAG TPA: VOC family protein, partial [Bacillota bacterium]|nr:VOC family protein [Bacillota bacterium]